MMARLEHQIRLRVEAADREDVYRDIARMPEAYRTDCKGRRISEGEVVKLTTRERSVFVLARGCGNSTEPIIRLDERVRNRLGVYTGQEAEFRIQQVRLPGQFRWAWSASDPAYRIVARLAVLSVVLGAVGLVLGLCSLWLSWRIGA